MKNDVGSVDDICVFCEKGFEEGQETSRVFISLSQHDSENCVFAKVHKECSDSVRENGLGNAREVALDVIGPLVSYKKACDFLFVHLGMFFMNEFARISNDYNDFDSMADTIERQIMFKGAVNIISSIFEKSVDDVIADTCNGRVDMSKVIDFSFLNKSLYSQLSDLEDEE